jgi:hypothetical protein
VRKGRSSGSVLLWGGVALSLLVQASPVLAGFDLVVDPSGVVPITFQTISANTFACAKNESCFTGNGNRRVMRFGNAIANRGNADIIIGTPPPDGESDAIFHWDTCHQHHHLTQIMKYELLNANGVVSVGRKINFCMADSRPWDPNAPPSAHTCSGIQGITRGWEDVYSPGLDCQWLDITGLPDGTYTLRLTVDPTNKYAEDDETNNVTTRVVVLQATVGVDEDTASARPTLTLVGRRPDWGSEAVEFTTGNESGRVTLSVYDVAGRERRVLLDQDEAAQMSEYVPWRGLDQSGRLLPSGVYYVRLRLPHASITRPVLILSGS